MSLQVFGVKGKGSKIAKAVKVANSLPHPPSEWALTEVTCEMWDTLNVQF